MTEETKTHECSFCSKSNDEVVRRIAGPKGAVICSECVAVCVQLIDREEEAEARAQPAIRVWSESTWWGEPSVSRAGSPRPRPFWDRRCVP